jgi:predicted protein tyrosine phosphatase
MAKPNGRDYFKKNQKHSVKSAGTSNEERIKVTEGLVKWANLIFVMEKKHKKRLSDKFGALMDDKKIVTIDIRDEYKYMDPELVGILETSVSPYFSLDALSVGILS